MKTLKKITNFVSGNMAVIVIVVAAIALFSPQTVSFLKTSYVNPAAGRGYVRHGTYLEAAGF